MPPPLFSKIMIFSPSTVKISPFYHLFSLIFAFFLSKSLYFSQDQPILHIFEKYTHLQFSIKILSPHSPTVIDGHLSLLFSLYLCAADPTVTDLTNIPDSSSRSHVYPAIVIPKPKHSFIVAFRNFTVYVLQGSVA